VLFVVQPSAAIFDITMLVTGAMIIPAGHAHQPVAEARRTSV
jgi:hypothetical protein